MYSTRLVRNLKLTANRLNKLGYSSPGQAALKCNEKYLQNLESNTNSNKRLSKRIDNIQNDIDLKDTKLAELPFGTTVSVHTAKTYGYTDYFSKHEKKVDPSLAVGDEPSEISSGKGIKEKFNDPHTRCMLYRASGFDIECILPRKITQRNKNLSLRLMTTKQILNKQSRVDLRAKQAFVCPPDMYPRSEINQLLSKDPLISGHETHDILFVDISQAAIGKDEFSVDDEELHRDRWITVREPSGELRLARWDERDIGLGVFYMEQREEFDSNRKIRPCPPSLMVEHTSFGDALVNGQHRQLLERGLVQFNIDSKDWISLRNAVFRDIIKRRKICDIYSTRFYPLFISWIQEENSLITLDAYKVAICLLVMGKNDTSNTLAGPEEMKSMINVLTTLNRFKLVKSFQMNTSELDNSLTKIEAGVIKSKANVAADFIDNSEPGTVKDSALGYALDDAKYKSLGMDLHDNIYKPVLKHLALEAGRLFGSDMLEIVNLFKKSVGEVEAKQDVIQLRKKQIKTDQHKQIKFQGNRNDGNRNKKY